MEIFGVIALNCTNRKQGLRMLQYDIDVMMD